MTGSDLYSYEDAGYQDSDLRKVRDQLSHIVFVHGTQWTWHVRQMTFLLNSQPVDALALIVHVDHVTEIGRLWVQKLCTWRIVSLPF